MMAVIRTSIQRWVVVVASGATCALSSHVFATHFLPSVGAVGGVGIQARLAASAFAFQEFHAHFRLHFRGNLVREGAVVTTIAASASAEVAADIARISMKILAAKPEC